VGEVQLLQSKIFELQNQSQIAEQQNQNQNVQQQQNAQQTSTKQEEFLTQMNIKMSQQSFQNQELLKKLEDSERRFQISQNQLNQIVSENKLLKEQKLA